METFEEHSILFKFKEKENFNHRHTLSISRIEILYFDTEIGQKGLFFKGLQMENRS